jgi:hypothetical protein
MHACKGACSPSREIVANDVSDSVLADGRPARIDKRVSHPDGPPMALLERLLYAAAIACFVIVYSIALPRIDPTASRGIHTPSLTLQTTD